MSKKLRIATIIFLSAVLCLSAALGFAVYRVFNVRADGISVWDGNLGKAGWGEASSAVKPNGYVVDDTAKSVSIGSADALAYFAHESNLAANNGFEGYTVYLECDIDLGGANNVWIPIGFASRKTAIASGVAFKGTFDGKNHTIYNLDSSKFYEKLTYENGKWIVEGTSIEVPAGGGGSYNYGLIAASANAVIKNLNMSGIKISLAAKTVEGKTAKTDSVGAIIGFNAGNLTVTDCVVGNEKGGDFISNTVCTGGIVGRAYAGLKDGAAAEAGQASDNDYLIDGEMLGDVEFTNCVNYVNVTDNANDKAGGILGYSAYEKTLTFENCENYGEINARGSYSGGIVSFIAPQKYFGVKRADGTIEHISHVYTVKNCVNYGDVTGKISSTGGIFGRYEDFVGLLAGDTADYSLIVHDCKNYGTIDGSENSAGSGAGGGITSYLYINGTESQPAKTSVELLRCFNYGDILGANAAGLVTSLSGNYATHKNIRISGGNSGRVASASADRNDVHQVITGCVNGTIYSMYDLSYHKSVWEVEYFIDAYKIVDYAKKTIGTASANATLIYADSARTEIVGVNVDADGPCKVVIPAHVKKIGFAAFAGKFNITEVLFEEGSQLEEISDWAFGGTSIEKINIPSTVKTIGAGAFGDCIKLSDVTLPAEIESIGQAAFGNGGNIANIGIPNGKVEIGNYALSDALWIAADKAEYEALTDVGGTFEGEDTDVITYPITLKYVHNDVVIDTETRLFGHSYKLVYLDGKWSATESNMVGTNKTRAYGGNLWYCKTADGSELRAWIQNMDTFLLNADNISDGVATIEARLDTDKIYIPREDLIYDENRSYTIIDSDPNKGGAFAVEDANELLAENSVKIPNTAVVTVNTYYNGDGKGQGVPKMLCNAGTYVFTVNEGEKTYKFSVTIARKEVDLSLRDNLDWKLSKVENAVTESSLLDSCGMTLYMYVTSGGGAYPSLTPLKNASLTQEQKNLGINENNYTLKTVRYSVVRNLNALVEISIADRDEFWVTHSGNRRSDVGAYQAIANLNAHDNYTFVQNGEIQDNELRGVRLTIAANGRTAVVEKNWYIVDVNNRFITSLADGEYDLSDREFGSTADISLPRLMYGDISEFGGEKDPVTLRLYRGSLLIGEFKRDEFGKYINSAMPVGRYSLLLSAKSVTYTDPIDGSVVTECGEVSLEVVFNVTETALPQSITDAINDALKGKSFSYDWDGNAHWYDAAAKDAIEKAIASYVAPARQNTIWAQSIYDGLYGEIELTFNLMRWQNEEYYETDNAAICAVDPDKYYVYYKVSAPNYVDSISGLADETRIDYCFTVTIVREISAPAVNAVTYNGSAQKADIDGNGIYTVKAYDGFTDVGSHKVTLTLVNSDYYRWSGKELGEADITVSFEITKALNEWIQNADIVRWVEGSFNEQENRFIGASKFGSIVYVITDTDDNVIYDLSQSIDNRSAMKAGEYFLKATVNGTDNYNGLSESFTIRIMERLGMPWWGTMLIVLGALAVAEAIILILWKLKVFKISLAITTRATVDATVAAVRAAKTAEEAQAHANKVKARERLEAAREAERNKTPEQKAQELAAKAEVTATKADKMHARASKLRERADKLAVKAEQEKAAEQSDDGSTEE